MSENRDNEERALVRVLDVAESLRQYESNKYAEISDLIQGVLNARRDDQVEQIAATCRTILEKVNLIMAALDDLSKQVESNTSAEQSAVVLLNNLHDLLVQAQNDPAKIAEITKTLADSRDALAAAVVANTPAA